MMLTYLGSGTRNYCDKPVRIFARQCWEFEAVLHGYIAPVLASGLENRGLCTDCIWVFPPRFEHGWTGSSCDADVAVFHFDRIPDSAAIFIRQQHYLQVPLSTHAKDTIVELVKETKARQLNPDTLASLHFEKACAELCIIALEQLPKGLIVPYSGRAEYVAAAACAWYSEHMDERPSIAATAQALNSSYSHFRRQFSKARGYPPEKAFEDLRMERALEFLHRGDASIKEIANACGYENQSSFSRAFRQRFDAAPSRYAPIGREVVS